MKKFKLKQQTMKLYDNKSLN